MVSSVDLADLRETFTSRADKQVARDAAAYMRDQFEFLGLKTPLRRELSKDVTTQSRELSERELIRLC
jgi:hypothetical protein